MHKDRKMLLLEEEIRGAERNINYCKSKWWYPKARRMRWYWSGYKERCEKELKRLRIQKLIRNSKEEI